MKAYKGFNKDMTCLGFRYEEGKEYEEEQASVCYCGFHACVNPLDTLSYYKVSSSVYHEVEMSGDIDLSEIEYDIDTKICSTKIKIGPVMKIAEIIENSIAYMMEHFTVLRKEPVNSAVISFEKKSISTISDSVSKIVCNSGEQSIAKSTNGISVAVSTGASSIALVENMYSIAANVGDYSCSVARRDDSIAASNGKGSVTETFRYNSASVNIGIMSVAESVGEHSISVNGGNSGKACASGHGSVAIATGHFATAEVKEAGNIACATGCGGAAKGCVGSWLLLSEWNDGSTTRNNVALFYVNGEKVKADTFYKLYNGELVKA